MSGGTWLAKYIAALDSIECSPLASFQQMMDDIAPKCRRARQAGNRVFFIGNGGSAGICSHMAADWLKNGRFRALCFNDGALMSCIANDLGYKNSFAEPLAQFVQKGDIVFAISSSGKSENILHAVDTARMWSADTVTLSGFDADNPLRQMGGMHFYVPSHEYGFVECVHQAILHAILDTVMIQ